MLTSDKTDIRAERHSVTQEDFTPPVVVDDMLAKLSEDAFTDFSKTVLDPSCGIGNFLVEILKRRLEHCSSIADAIDAARTLYGVELMADNVEECRQRLYDTVLEVFPKPSKNDDFCLRSIIRNRIQWHDSMSFDYDRWPSTTMKPCEKHETKSFRVVRHPEDKFYPMWREREPEQLNLF